MSKLASHNQHLTSKFETTGLDLDFIETVKTDPYRWQKFLERGRALNNVIHLIAD